MKLKENQIQFWFFHHQTPSWAAPDLKWICVRSSTFRESAAASIRQIPRLSDYFSPQFIEGHFQKCTKNQNIILEYYSQDKDNIQENWVTHWLSSSGGKLVDQWVGNPRWMGAVANWKGDYGKLGWYAFKQTACANFKSKIFIYKGQSLGCTWKICKIPTGSLKV